MSMQITDVRVKLCGENSEQLKAFCSITLDDYFVVRDLKVIEGATGLFVAMPSRKLSDRCNKCRHKNHLRARFCNDCGAKLRENRSARGGSGRSKLYVDVAHPINSDCRKLVQETVVEAYKQEVERSHQPDYVPQDYDEEETTQDVEAPEELETTSPDEEVDEVEQIREVRAGRGTNEYDDLIRHLKNDAMTRRQGIEPAVEPEPEVSEASEYKFADDDQDLALEQPRNPAPRSYGAPRRDSGPSRPGREDRGQRPPQEGRRDGGRRDQRRGEGGRDRDRSRRSDGPPRSDHSNRSQPPQRREAPPREEIPSRQESAPRPAPQRRPESAPVVAAPKPPPPPPPPVNTDDDFGAGLL